MYAENVGECVIPEPSQDDAISRAGILATLMHRDFTLLAVGQMFSQFATSMQQVVVAWQIYELTDSSLSVGLTGLARAGAVILFSLIGGVVADAMDRRKVLLLSQAVTLSGAVTLALLTSWGQIAPWMIYAVVFATGAATSFDFPARRALIPSLVNRIQVPTAATTVLAVRRGSMVTGPSLGGVLITWIGIAFAYWAVVLCILLLVACLLSMRARPRAGHQSTGIGIAAFADGLRFLWESKQLLVLLCVTTVILLFTSSQSVWPALARDVLDAGPSGLGLLASSVSVGSMLGLVLALRWGEFERKGLVTAACAVGMGLTVVALAAAPTLAVAAGSLLCFGVLDSINDSVRHTLIATRTPDELLGRVNGVATVFASGGLSLGELWMGFLAEALTPRVGLGAAGLFVMTAAIGLMLFARSFVTFRTRAE